MTASALGARSAQKYARVAGLVIVASFLVGILSDLYAPAQLTVPGDAIATAHKVVSSGPLLRLGFIAYIGDAVTDVSLNFLLYVLLRPVWPNLALLALLFRIMAIATFAFAQIFYFAPTLILSGDAYLTTFSPAQLATLALLSLRVYSNATNLFLFFYGIGSIVFGYLMFRSGYLPKLLGALLMVGGVGFVVRNVLWLLAPAYASFAFLVPTLLAGLVLGAWLLIWSVDPERWAERQTVSDSEPTAAIC